MQTEITENKVCSKCGVSKHVDDFYNKNSSQLSSQCKSCHQETIKNRRQFYKKSGHCVYCGKPSVISGIHSCNECTKKKASRAKKWALKNSQRLCEKRKIDQRKLKEEVFTAYGGILCVCCGETAIEFLSIDHIQQNGAEHRKQMTGNSRNGVGLYRWLKRNGFPSGFRVLCMNCNFAYGHFGYCPHKK